MKTKLMIRSTAAALIAIALGACASLSPSPTPAASRSGSDDRRFNAQTGIGRAPRLTVQQPAARCRSLMSVGDCFSAA